MRTRSNLATWHLYPKEGKMPEEAFGRYPCDIDVTFQSRGLENPHTAKVAISTLFGQVRYTVKKKICSVRFFENSGRKE